MYVLPTCLTLYALNSKTEKGSCLLLDSLKYSFYHLILSITVGLKLLKGMLTSRVPKSTYAKSQLGLRENSLPSITATDERTLTKWSHLVGWWELGEVHSMYNTSWHWINTTLEYIIAFNYRLGLSWVYYTWALWSLSLCCHFVVVKQICNLSVLTAQQ